MSEVGTYSVEGEIGIVSINSPPVNALGLKVRRAIDEGIATFAADPAIKAIVLMCEGRTFFAGADISEFGAPMQAPTLHQVLDHIEDCPKLVIAAIHGTALGGGLETALVAHYRIAVPSAKMGLPEVHLGLLPGAGGTQRLPRIVGAAMAMEMMTSGRPIGAKVALEHGVIDALATEGKLREDAVEFAKRLVAEKAPLKRVRDRTDKIAPDKGNKALYADFIQKNARAFRGFKAPFNIIKAVEAAVEEPSFEAGIKRELELFAELHDSKESAAQRYYFFAERETAKIPDVPSSTPTLDIKKVGVIGAGTMGGGITMNFLNIGVPVTLVETTQAALDRGLSVIRKNYENTAKKGRMTQEQVEARMALIRPSLALEDLAQVDLVIEAVFESMPVKKEVFTKLDSIVRQGAILASNTSFLDVNEIAACTKRPEWVVGLHFFSPANVMRLLEVVRGAKTSKEVIATAMKLSKAIGKVPVLAGVCDGFIANRLMTPRMHQAEALVMEGPTPTEIDRVIYDYGFAMGPFAMIDLIGLDVIGRDDKERNLRGDMVAAGRLGQKNGKGFYDYDENRKATPSPEAAKIIADLAAFKGVANKGAQSDDAILTRLLYPIVNEGAKILEEGIALRASDIDVAAILGYNWPVYTGGPMFWAQTVGLAKVVEGLKALQAQHGDAFRPSALLERLAKEGKGWDQA